MVLIITFRCTRMGGEGHAHKIIIFLFDFPDMLETGPWHNLYCRRWIACVMWSVEIRKMSPVSRMLLHESLLTTKAKWCDQEQTSAAKPCLRHRIHQDVESDALNACKNKEIKIHVFFSFRILHEMTRTVQLYKNMRILNQLWMDTSQRNLSHDAWFFSNKIPSNNLFVLIFSESQDLFNDALWWHLEGRS